MWQNFKVSLLGRLLTALRHGLAARSVSSGYIQLSPEDVDYEASRLLDAWKNEDIPLSQRSLVDNQLAIFRSGLAVDVFDVFLRAICSLPQEEMRMNLLEIGCSSGYYSEVIKIAGLNVDYEGCDYSQAFIDLARLKYPNVPFTVDDATKLRYRSESFYIVVSGCCLLHIPEYEKAIAEAVRVAKRFVIFHRTPVVVGQPTLWFTKRAYGVETIEIHLNEKELMTILSNNGLEVVDTITLCEHLHKGVGRADRTYVCEK